MSDAQTCPWCAANVPAHITVAAQNPFCAACGRNASAFATPVIHQPPVSLDMPVTEVSGTAETGISIIQRYPDGRVICIDAFPTSPSSHKHK